MTLFAVSLEARFIVHADCPQTALEWANADVELRSRTVGHVRRVVELSPAQQRDTRTLDVDAFHAANGSLVLRWEWAPSPWPARAYGAVRALQHA